MYDYFETHYNRSTQAQINGLLDKIEKLKANFETLYDQAIVQQNKTKYG